MDATHLALQRLLGDPSPFREDLAAKSRGWRALQESRIPEPSRLRPVRRRNWHAAMEAGAAFTDTPRELDVALVPVWMGDNDVEEPDHTWCPSAALLAPDLSDSELLPDEDFDQPLDHAYGLRIMVQHVVRLAEGAHGDFGPFTLQHVRIRQLVAVTEANPVEPSGLEAPREAIPGYSLRVVPACVLESELQARLNLLLADLE